VIAALLALGCAPQLGVMYNGERLPVVDMHLHQGEWMDIPAETRSVLAALFPAPLGLFPELLVEGIITGEGVLSELDRGGVSQGALMAVYTPRSLGITTNAFVLEQITADPQRLMGMASLRVDAWSTDADAQLAALSEALADPRMIGIKLAPAHQHFRMDDPAYFGVYAVAAERGAPVYVHTGPSPFPGTTDEAPYTDPRYLEEAIHAWPEVDFLLGHLAFDETDGGAAGLAACLELAAAYENVYLEPSAFGAEGSDPDGRILAGALSQIRAAGLVERVIYGSDGPQRPGFVADYLERTVAAMQAAGYTTGEARAVLSENFARVYGVEAASL